MSMQNYCEANSISFIFITDIIDKANKSLVASDVCIPELAYSLFVERMYQQHYCNSQLKT
jgi:hypothetical protein